MTHTLARQYHGQRLVLALFGSLILSLELTGQAGGTFTISVPVAVLRDNVVEISYDINGVESGLYAVELNVWDRFGRIITPVSLTGDVGSGVRGGRNKQMKWDLGNDRLFLNSSIYFEVTARLANPPGNNSQEVSNAAEIILSDSERKEEEKSYSNTGIVAGSMLFPGIGLSRITGKPHWIRGVAGYSCLAGAVVLNDRAIRSYQQISGYPDFESRQEQLQKSIHQDTYSEILIFTAIGIWVTDLIWNVAGLHSYHWISLTGETGRLLLEPALDPLTFAPMIGLKFLL